MFLLIDNYDSFTYNLFHYLRELGVDVLVKRNDEITLDEIHRLKVEGIILSPGPCTPNEAGICLDVIKEFHQSIPIFGVCLGHQSIGQAFGGTIVRAPNVMHGKVSQITHKNKGVFKDIPSPFEATRYHSLIIEEETLPNCLTITARSEDGLIMGVAHKSYPVEGVQFHPESIASEHGHALLDNFIKRNVYCNE